MEGGLSRYNPEERDWVSVEKDAPLGKGDILSSDKRGKAEFIMPNNTRAMTGGDSETRLLEMNERITEFDMDSGVALCYNRSSDSNGQGNHSFWRHKCPSQTSFDVYVDEESVEVVALKGTVDCFHTRDNSRFEVGAPSFVFSCRPPKRECCRRAGG